MLTLGSQYIDVFYCLSVVPEIRPGPTHSQKPSRGYDLGWGLG